MKNAIIYFIVYAAIQAGVGAAVIAAWAMATGSQDITANELIVSMIIVNVLAAAIFLLAKWSKVSPNYMKTQPWGVLVWSSLVAVGAVIPMSWLQELMPSLPNIVANEMGMMVNNEWGYFVIALLAPLVEELIFRGAILRALLEKIKRQWVAIAISALFFSLIHANPAQMPFAFVAGLFLGWTYYRTGSILPGVAYHWINNSIAFALAKIYQDPDIPLIAVFGGNQTAVYMAVLFSLCILVPSILQLNLRMKNFPH